MLNWRTKPSCIFMRIWKCSDIQPCREVSLSGGAEGGNLSSVVAAAEALASSGPVDFKHASHAHLVLRDGDLP